MFVSIHTLTSSDRKVPPLVKILLALSLCVSGYARDDMLCSMCLFHREHPEISSVMATPYVRHYCFSSTDHLNPTSVIKDAADQQLQMSRLASVGSSDCVQNGHLLDCYLEDHPGRWRQEDAELEARLANR